ncbi:DapH/DapD/GlmU-related protein [Corynebacterium vitaeruminis]|uniref:DapH/DapD/GlmU-related protein n=1 Tax=Corynebacterium vitaeruminis TaxID=38305 RepID=UPI0023F6757B|nr:DapH/DapD/GlmU-related protein [Corynebacterium vitaeruminis]
MTLLGAHALGIANIAMDGTVLDTWYPTPELTTHISHPAGTTRLGAHDLPPKLLSLVRIDEDRMVEQIAVRTTITDLQLPPVDAHDVYLRLHLLSHRLVKPHELNMEDALNKLATVVWTNKGPCLPENFENVRTLLRSRGLIHVYGIDRLPRMVDYVVPTGVHITEAERVRLGAYLAPGTWVLREGFVSYNAGTLGPGRVEGRLSSGTVVGANMDMGISSSLVSPKHPRELKVGDNCSLGVSSAILQINLGDNVHVGNNVVIDPDTYLYFADSDETALATKLAGESNWSIRMEPGHPEPVARRIAPIEA